MNRNILKLAIPAMLANITIPLVGLVDVAIAGHIADASAIAGIAVATTIFDLLYWGFGFLRIGTGGMTAQAYGAGLRGEYSEVFVQSAVTASVGALVIWVIQWPFSEMVLHLMGCDAATEAFAREYFQIRVWAAPATLLLMTLKGWFIGMQDTVVPMVSDLTVNLINMGCSYWLAVSLGMGVRGVAFGTLIAQYSGLLVTLLLLAKKHPYIIFSVNPGECLAWKRVKRLFVLNSNIFIRSICFMVVYVGFTKLTTLYGTTEIALGAIIMKLFMLFSYMVDGFAYAGEALTGRFIGARQRGNLIRAVRLLFLWSMAIAAVTSFLFCFWGIDFVCLISNDTAVSQSADRLSVYIVLMPLVSAAAFMWDGIFAGATAGREIRNCMIVAVVSFLGCYYLLESWAGIHALYIAYFAHLAGRVVYLSVKYPSLLRHNF